MTFISHTVSWLASHLCPWPLLNTLTVWEDGGGSLVWEEIWRLRHTHFHPPSPQQLNIHHGQTISVLSYISKKDYFLLSATGLKAAHQGSWNLFTLNTRLLLLLLLLLHPCQRSTLNALQGWCSEQHTRNAVQGQSVLSAPRMQFILKLDAQCVCSVTLFSVDIAD